MALPTISAGDLLNKGTTGMPANPELSAGDLQAKFDELSLDVIVPKFQALVTALENASAGVDLGVTAPTGITASNKVKSVLDAIATVLLALKDTAETDYDRLVVLFGGIDYVTNFVDGEAQGIPTCKAIADYVQDMGGGDMVKTIYDTNNNGIVDNAERLGGVLASAYALQANLTLYVATTGNDTTGTGTSGNPYATISKALSVIPKNLNGYDMTINVGAGTYTDNIFIDGLHGGRLIVSVNGVVILNGYIAQVDSAVTVQIQTSSSGTLTINNTPNYANGAIYMTSSQLFQITNVPLVINSITQGIFANNSSNFYSASSVEINNATSYAVQSGIGSFVSFSSALTGSNNSVGLRANSAVISYNTNNISATTPTQKINGGIITNELYPTKPTGIAWAGGSTTPTSYLCYKTGDMVHLDFTMPITTGIIGGSVVGELPVGFRPNTSTGYRMGGFAFDKATLGATDKSFGILCSIASNGQIQIASNNSGTMYNACVSIEFFIN